MNYAHDLDDLMRTVGSMMRVMAKVAALVVGLGLFGCAARRTTVTVIESCVPARGYACDWIAALEVAESGVCDDELRDHWSAEVRNACADPDGEIDRWIRSGAQAQHFADHPVSTDPGEVIPRTVDERVLRTFSFPAVNGSGTYWPKLSHKHDVVVATATEVGVLVGIDQGEWGGGLVVLPSRGEPELLLRAPILDVFEAGGRVYVISSNFRHPTLYEVSREASAGVTKWRLELIFLLPGWHFEVRRLGEDVLLVTDSGTVILHPTGAMEVAPGSRLRRVSACPVVPHSRNGSCDVGAC